MDELYRIVERLGVLGGCLERGGTKSGHSNLSMMILRTPLGWETPSIPTLDRQLTVTESTFAFNERSVLNHIWSVKTGKYEDCLFASFCIYLLFLSVSFGDLGNVRRTFWHTKSAKIYTWNVNWHSGRLLNLSPAFIILDSDQMNTGSWFWILAEMMYVAKWRIKSSQRTSSPRGPFWPSEYSSHLLWCTYNTRCRDHPLF